MMWKYLDQKVTDVQLTEDFMDNLQTLCIWNHGIILSCYVKILQDTQKRSVQHREFSQEGLSCQPATNVFKDDLHIDKTLCNVHGSWLGCHDGTLWQCGSVLCWLSCSWLNTGQRAPGKTDKG